MRYAKLQPGWLLRGWIDEPRTVGHWRRGDWRTVSEPTFRALLACDGITDFDNRPDVFQQHLILRRLIEAGIAEECFCGDSPEPYQLYRQADSPFIRTVQWAVTGRCNLRCSFCYIESPDGRFDELPLKDMTAIMDSLAAANVHQVSLTGGEPFVRSDLMEIMAALADRQIAVTRIFSNGVLITPEALQTIKALGFFPVFQISFDGCGAHDAMRGIHGVEEAATNAIKLLRGQGFAVSVVTCLDKTNAASLPRTYELLKDLTVQGWKVTPLRHLGGGRNSGSALSPDELLTACAPVAARWNRDGRPFRIQMAGYSSDSHFGDQENRYAPDSYDCQYCRQSCSILPDGIVIPCPDYSDAPWLGDLPSVLNQSISSIWQNSLLRDIIDIQKKDILEANTECQACSLFPVCGGGCRGLAVAATGDLYGIDRRWCEIMKGNYRDRLIQAATGKLDWDTKSTKI